MSSDPETVKKSDSRVGAQFAASLTHAFRSRLNAVLGSLELVSQTKLTAEQTRFVTTAMGEGQALLYLVKDALYLGRIGAGELGFEDGVIDPVAIAEAAMGVLAASFHANNISATCVIDPMTPVILRGDGMRLGQILVNLLMPDRYSSLLGRTRKTTAVRDCCFKSAIPAAVCRLRCAATNLNLWPHSAALPTGECLV